MPCRCWEEGRRAAPGQHRGRRPRRRARPPGSCQPREESQASVTNAESTAGEPLRPFVEPFVSYINSTTRLGIAATLVLPDSALVRSRTALPQRMFRPLFAVIEPVKIVGGGK